MAHRLPCAPFLLIHLLSRIQGILQCPGFAAIFLSVENCRPCVFALPLASKSTKYFDKETHCVTHLSLALGPPLNAYFPFSSLEMSVRVQAQLSSEQRRQESLQRLDNIARLAGENLEIGSKTLTALERDEGSH